MKMGKREAVGENINYYGKPGVRSPIELMLT